MNQVAVVHTGAITAMGDDLEALWQGLLDRESAITTATRFATDNYISSCAALINDLVPDSKKAMVFQLADRVMEQLPPLPRDTLVLTASTKGGIDVLETARRGTETSKEQLIISSLPGYIARRLGLAHQGINISAACTSSTIALAKAAAFIASGRASSVLVCAVDIISEFVFSGFSALKAMSSTPARPFDSKRDGLTLGDGAAALVLFSEEKMKKEGIEEKALITGWGIANDATHITAPARNGCGLKRAVSHALAMAGIPPDRIGAVSTHGTGTVYNDAMELTALHSLCGSQGLAAGSVKGAIGHTLGACGGIEAALGIRMLDHQVVPGTPGFTSPETGAGSMISSRHQPFDSDHLLTTNSGFGGINGALVLQKRRR